MSEEINHFECYEWFGLFSTPDETIHFPGKITYSPDNGIELEFMYIRTMGKCINPTRHIYGLLSNNKACTLYGEFNEAHFNHSYGEYSTCNGKIKFKYMALGAHIAPTEELLGIRVNLSNFGEFCCPQGFKHLAKATTKPICKFIKNKFEISIINTYDLKYLIDPANIFYCETPEVIDEITNKLNEVKDKFPTAMIQERVDIGWRFKITSDQGMDINECTYHVEKLEKFFSMLIYSPSRRTTTHLLKKERDGCFSPIPLLMSFFHIDKHEITTLKNEIDHHLLWIKLPNANIAELYAKWMDIENGASLFANLISNDFGKYQNYEIHSQIILLLTQLEFISSSAGKGSKEKYSFPLNEYGTQQIKDCIKQIFKKDDDESIGVCLSDIRADLAHVGRPIKYLEKIPLKDLLTIVKSLRIVIATYIYKQLELPDNLIAIFQKNYLKNYLI